MRSRSTLPLLLALVLVLTVPGTLAAQSVHVVDANGGPGTSFTQIQAAVEAAAPGDVILCRTGTYDTVVVDRPISIVADLLAQVVVEQVIVLSGATGDVVLSGLRTAPFFNAGLDTTNVPGSLFVQDSILQGGVGQAGVNVGFGASITSSSSVTFEACRLLGFTDDQGLPVAGLSTGTGSSVRLFGSTVIGGEGDAGQFIFPAEDGAAGVVAGVLDLFAQGSTIQGGDGGDGGSLCQGADGGDGIAFNSGLLESLDTAILGGIGGSSNEPCAPGVNGLPVSTSQGVHAQHPGRAPALLAPAVAREEQPITFFVDGDPGERVFLGFGRAQNAQTVPFTVTPLLIPPPSAGLVVDLGTIPAGGRLMASVLGVSLPAGREALKVQMQAALFAGGKWRLSNARSLTLLDEAFPF